MIKNFQELLEAANHQEQPQRLLLLFAKTEETASNGKGQSGTLSPIMCVDKLPEEIASFDAIVEEADGISQDWNFMLVAGLSGQDGKAPTPDEAEHFLNQMANQLASGEDLSRYMIFDRKENPVLIESA